MTDSKSFMEPFKARLLEVFNSSSSGDNPYANNPYLAREERKRKKEPAGKESTWEEESRNLFEDFLSLDEEKITHGLAKAKVRKALDKKYAQSRRRDQLDQETRALEDTLETTGISPEVTARKLAALDQWELDLARLLRTRYPALVGWVDLLGRPAWVHLAQQGMQPRFLLNLMILAWYRSRRREASEDAEALLFFQLHIQYLNLGLKADEIHQHLEKYTLEADTFESLLTQTLHAIERNGELIESFETLIKVRCSQARRYFLRLLSQPWLDPDKRLARFHLHQRYQRLRSQVHDIRERMQGQRAAGAAEMAWVLGHWRGHALALGGLQILNSAQQHLPLSPQKLAEALRPLGLSPESPEIRDLLGRLDLACLERWIRLSQLEPTPPADPGFISDSVLEQELAAAMAQEDWTTLEKWALLKAWYASGFRQQNIEPLAKQLESFLPLDLS